ncbi:MAG: flippase-like domain-containing protein [Chloroflexi bacterium]|nr:flippase-like domain-containing protein [Chloroflexota bacterium]
MSVPTLVSFAVAVALLAFLTTRFSIDLGATWQIIRHSNPLLYALALATNYTTFLFRGARWRLLLKNAATDKAAPLPTLGAAARLMLMGWFVSSVTWFRLGDFYRVYAYSEESGAPVVRGAGTVLAERVMDLILVFLLLLAGFLFLYADSTSRPSTTFLVVGLALALLAGVVLAAMVIFRKSVSHLLPQRLRETYQSFHEGTMRSFRTLPLVSLLGLLGWLSEVGRLFFVVQATGLHVSLGLVVFVTIANALLTAVPLSPGGLGIVEAGITGFLMLVLPRESAVSITLLDRSISYGSVVVLGGAAFLYHQRQVVRRASSLSTQRHPPIAKDESRRSADA